MACLRVSLPLQVFVIKIRLGSFAWTVYRRFSQFRQVSENLRRIIPDVPPCPPRRLLGGHSHSFLEQRRIDLTDWVRVVRRLPRRRAGLDLWPAF